MIFFMINTSVDEFILSFLRGAINEIVLQYKIIIL